MHDRYRLRFENGERQGEVIRLAGSLTTLGRRPGNTVQVADSSVSGRHAEITIDERGARIQDLGSTNGTKVGAEPVRDAHPLAHGDEVLLGNVRLRFTDATLGGGDEAAAAHAAPTASAASAASAAPSSGAVRQVSAAELERSTKRSLPIAALAVLLAGLAGAAYFWMAQRGGSGGAAAGRPVVVPAGDFLAESYSFEGGAGDGGEASASADPGWEPDPLAPVEFFASPLAAWSGEQGLAAEFGGLAEDGAAEDGATEDGATEGEAARADGADAESADSGAAPGPAGRAPESAPGRAPESAPEWALHRSPAVRVRAGQAFEASAQVATEGAGRARLGLAFESSADGGRASATWSDFASPAGFEALWAQAVVPPGCDRLRVLVLGALGAGAEPGQLSSVRVDDVSLVAAADAPELAAPRELGEYRFAVAGERRDVAVLFKIDRQLAGGFAVLDGAGPWAAAPALCARAKLAVEVDASGFAVSVSQAPSPAVLTWFVEPAPAAELATLGEAGYRHQRADFSEPGVASCLFGRGVDLARVEFEVPVVLSGRARDGGFELAAELAGAAGFRVQVAFSEERAAAAGLAERARAASREGQLGAALAAWDELVRSSPFEEELVREASEARSALVQAGLAELAGVRAGVERAGFFELPDLYRESRAAALAVAERYAGSEVEAESRALIESIDALAADLESGLDAREGERLAEIEALLEAGGMPRLAERVKSYRAEHFAAPAEGGR